MLNLVFLNNEILFNIFECVSFVSLTEKFYKKNLQNHTFFVHIFILFVFMFFFNLMAFTVWRTHDLNTNEKIISFYKKELYTSHIINKAKEQQHYNTKWYRKYVTYDVPSKRRYVRIRSLVGHMFRSAKRKYTTLAQLGKVF